MLVLSYCRPCGLWDIFLGHLCSQQTPLESPALLPTSSTRAMPEPSGHHTSSTTGDMPAMKLSRTSAGVRGPRPGPLPSPQTAPNFVFPLHTPGFLAFRGLPPLQESGWLSPPLDPGHSRAWQPCPPAELAPPDLAGRMWLLPPRRKAHLGITRESALCVEVHLQLSVNLCSSQTVCMKLESQVGPGPAFRPEPQDSPKAWVRREASGSS